jgi:hypothetical protein
MMGSKLSTCGKLMPINSANRAITKTMVSKAGTKNCPDGWCFARLGHKR